MDMSPIAVLKLTADSIVLTGIVVTDSDVTEEAVASCDQVVRCRGM